MLVLSGSVPQWNYFDGSTTALLIAGITAALRATGWSSTLTGTSPQSLTVQLVMTVESSTQISLKLHSTSGDSVKHYLYVNSNYQIWSNCCSFFISQPGVRHDYHGSVVVGGIPWAPPTFCEGKTDADFATEAWYCFGDSRGPGKFQESATPRVRFLMFGDLSHNIPDTISFGGYCNDAMWNGHYCDTVDNYATVHGATVWAGTPEILTFQEADDCEQFTYDNQTLFYYGLDSRNHPMTPCPMVYDPMLAWGDTVDQVAKIRGQIYDALIVSRGHYGDAPDTAEPKITTDLTSTYYWKNFTDQYYWGSLWLLVPKGTGGGFGNVAY